MYTLQYREHFYGIIFAPGLVYGQGEHILKYIYKTVFNDTDTLLIPIYDNSLPIIYIENLAKLNKIVLKNFLNIFNLIYKF